MEKAFSRPKQFGEILDLTFQLIKNNFKKLFLIVLLFNSPVIILQAIYQISAGQGIFRHFAPGDNLIDQFINTFAQTGEISAPFELAGDFFISLLSMLLYPLAFASVFLIIKHVKNNQESDLKQVAQQALSRFWPLFGSYFLFTIVAVLIISIPVSIIVIVAIVAFTAENIILGILSILLFFPALLGILLLLTRLSFFLPITVEASGPGLSASFRLSKGRTWMTFFIYFTLFIIVGVIGSSLQFLVLFLGFSVLYTLMLNLLGVFTSLILFVGYTVVYFDLKVRQSGSDLKQMIDDYQPNADAQPW